MSATGDWMLVVALPVFVFQLTGSALQTSSTLIVELVVRLATNQPAGIMVDRYDRRLLIIAGSVLEAVCLLPLLAVQHRSDVYLVYVVAALTAAVSPLTGLAISALTPDLVSAKDLVPTNAVLGLAGDLARLLGASVGGVVLGLIGLRGVVAVDAASFLIVWLLFARHLPPHHRERTEVGRSAWTFASWLDGMRAVREDPALWGGVVLGTITALAQGVFQVTFVVFVLENLHGSPADVGVLRGLIGVGTIAGGLTLTVLGSRWSGRALTTFGLLLMAITAAAAWNGPMITTNQNYYRVVFMLIGIPGVAAFIGVVQILQRHAPRDRRGRIFSLLNSVMNAGEGAGLLIGGLLADRIATTTILNGHVALLLLASIIAAIVLRDHVVKPTPVVTETTAVPEPEDAPAEAVVADTEGKPVTTHD